jgi:hypothetical protein
VALSCGHNNEPSGSIKGREFLDQLSYCQLLEENFAAWSWLDLFCFTCGAVLS